MTKLLPAPGERAMRADERPRAAGGDAAPAPQLTEAVDAHETHPVDRFFSTLLVS